MQLDIIDNDSLTVSPCYRFVCVVFLSLLWLCLLLFTKTNEAHWGWEENAREWKWEREREKKLCKHFVDRLRYVFQYSCRWPCSSCYWPKLYRRHRWLCPCWASIYSLPWYSYPCPSGQQSVCSTYTSGE